MNHTSRFSAVVIASAAIAGASLLSAPVASAAPAPSTVSTAGATASKTTTPRDMNPRVSRSTRGVLPSAYIGKYYNSKHESTRKCIVRRESGGNYRISSPAGKYRGAYQFNQGLANVAARKMGRSDLVGKNIRTWSRYEQDKAFWTIWNHGKGRGHWAGGRSHC